MKRLVSATTLVLVLGCGANAVGPVDEQPTFLTSLPTELTLQYGEERRVGGVLRLSFVEVLEDSRCPVDVTCVWAGNAKVLIGIGMGMGPTHPLELNSTLEPRAVDWNDVRVTLLKVTPEPRSTDTIPLEAYAVRLRLEAVP